MQDSELASLLEGTADAAFAVDLQGQIRTWNRAAMCLFGCEPSLTIGRPCAAVVNGRREGGSPVCRQDCQRLERLRRTANHRRTRYLGAEGTDFDIEAHPPGRAPFWCNVSLLVATDAHTDRCLVVHFVRNIDDRKRAERFASDVRELVHRLESGLRAAVSGFPPLTAQEERILELLRRGVGTKEIARRLEIGTGTLRNHVHHLHQKLGTHSRLEAVVTAEKRGLA